MAAHAAPTVEDHRAAIGALFAHVAKEDVVAPERLAQSSDVVARQVLLPVDPPEVDALRFALADDVLEHRAIERRVFQHPRHALAEGDVHVGGYLVVVVLIRRYAVGRMQVERNLQPLLVHPSDESGGVGDDALVPCPARPSVEVPVHIHDHHVDGYVVLLDFVGQVDKLLLRVALVFAVPVAQGIEWGHGLPSGYLRVVGKGLTIVVAVAHEVPVVGIGVYRFGHPGYAVYVVFKSKGRRAVATLRLGRLVDDGPP